MGDGANFSDPARFDGHVLFEIVQNGDSAKDNDVSGDNKHGKPDSKMFIIVPPWSEGECNDAGEKEEFIGDGVDKCAEFRALVESAGDIAINAIAGCGEDEYGDGESAGGFGRAAELDAFTVVDGQQGKDGDEKNSREGDE